MKRNRSNHHTYKKGFTLIEVVVSLVVFTISISVIFLSLVSINKYHYGVELKNKTFNTLTMVIEEFKASSLTDLNKDNYKEIKVLTLPDKGITPNTPTGVYFTKFDDSTFTLGSPTENIEYVFSIDMKIEKKELYTTIQEVDGKIDVNPSTYTKHYEFTLTFSDLNIQGTSLTIKEFYEGYEVKIIR